MRGRTRPRHDHPRHSLTLRAQDPPTVRIGSAVESHVRRDTANGSMRPVEYLAVAQMPRRWSRKIPGTFLRRGYRLPRAWHALPTYATSSAALCGFRTTREPHRTWAQTMIPRRCPQCQRLVDEALARAADPSNNALWAVAAPDDAVLTHSRAPSIDVQRNGVVPAT